MKKGDVVECEIKSMAFGGAGVTRITDPAHDGMPEREFVVFVEGTVPGDLVKAKIFLKKKKFAEARLVDLVKPSDLRIAPKCKYFGDCGGCKMQFLAYEKQLSIKQQQVQDAVQRIGGFSDFLVEEIIGCEQPWFYRNKMEFSFAWEDDPRECERPRISFGLHPGGKRFEVLDIEECFLQSEFSVKFLNAVRQYARGAKWEPFNYRTGEGFVRSIYIREGKWTNEIMVNLVTAGGVDGSSLKEFFKWIDGEFPEINSGYWTKISAERGQRTQINEKLMFGKETLRDEIRVDANSATLKFDILPQAFFQPNTKQAGALYSQIFRLAEIGANTVVFDLFCGTGTIALFCAQKARKVFGIELNESAVVNARANASLNGIENVEFVVGDVGEMVTEIREKPDVIVMDPPRAGVGEKTLEKVLSFGAGKIVYVSCNPSTLARDLKFLGENGYALKNVQPVDMFPQTAHIECVAYLERI